MTLHNSLIIRLTDSPNHKSKKMSKYLTILTIAVIMATGNAGAQVNVSAQMDTSMLLIGDQTNIRLESSFPQGYAVQMPIFADTIIRGLEVLEAGKIDSTITDGIIHISQKYLVTSFDSGWYAIPQQPFAIAQPDGFVDTIYSESIYYGVMTMPLDTANPNAITDIKPLQEAPFKFSELKPYLKIGGLVLLALAIIGFIIYVIIRYKHNKPIFSAPKPKEPAHVIALRQLDQLNEQKLWQHGLVKEYYSALSDIIRTYLNGRFGVQAMESTTAEIMQMTRSITEIDRDLRKELQELLERADFVKFAKAQTVANENEASFEFVMHFILKTKPVEQLRDEEIDDTNSDEKE